MIDFVVASEGEKTRTDYAYEYKHSDGRNAMVHSNGDCTDPELATLLAARFGSEKMHWHKVLPLRVIRRICLGLNCTLRVVTRKF